jgi:cell division protein FtsI (penicillin-binding protein 3)
MPQRPDEPRRGSTEPRRGSGQGDGDGFTGISEARAYTPRGRTVRDRTPRSSRTSDPFRPALQVVEGGGRQRRGAEPEDHDEAAGVPNPRKRTPQRAGRDQTAPREDPAPRGRTAGAGRDAEGPRARTGSATKPAKATKPAVKPAAKAAPATKAARPASKAARPAKAVKSTKPRRPPGPPRLADSRRRLRVGTVLALTLFATVGIRLVALQFTDSPTFAAKGLDDRLARVDLPAPRGAIYDRNGAVLAHSVEARYVAVDPELVKDPAKTAAKLSPLLGIPQSELVGMLRKRTQPGGGASRFEYLARGVDIATGDEVKALALPEIIVKRDERREVPGHDLAANIIGFTGDGLNGLEGIEARYDELLRGVNGKRVYEIGNGNLAAEIPGGYRKETKAQPGSSLELTIDRDLQYKVQHILAENMARVKATTGAAVVIDVRTGEVLAQASHPVYDAADWKKSKSSDRDDAASSFIVDPGSVHKAITIGAALQEGAITPDSTIVVEPRITRGGKPFTDTHPPPGYKATPMTIPGILAYSSNIGTIHIADKLGAEKLVEYQKKFGLGSATGEGVPGEATGRVLEPKDWSGSASGSVPIGHSVDVTPLQMAAAYAAIANDGVWVQPHLVRETIAPDGKRTPTAAPQSRQVISADNAKALRQMLEAVVTVPEATGRKAAVPGYRVAGKTGTGSRVVNGQYVSGAVASFVGMAPADNPRYVIAVFAHVPAGEGGEVAAPAFREMMAYTLTHYRVPATSTKPPKFTVYP